MPKNSDSLKNLFKNVKAPATRPAMEFDLILVDGKLQLVEKQVKK